MWSDKIEFGISMGSLSGAKEEARRGGAGLRLPHPLTGEHLMFYTPVANNPCHFAAPPAPPRRLAG
ncbi:MAG: hypothetical protein R2755_08575 [Acidimicrobiales bacterium]